MTKETLDSVIVRTCRWFERRARTLPWRDDPTPYRVWISEIMLQQTQVATVIPYFERFIRRFDDVNALAAAPVDEVLTVWSGLGYYSRARNLHRGAQVIVGERRGRMPETREEWLEIPGVGPYTAGAIASIACGHPEPIVDGNIERVFSRIFGLRRAGFRSDADFKARLWSESGRWVERAYRVGLSPSVANQALMELGATVCMPANPRCTDCPVGTRACTGARSGDPWFWKTLPGPKKRAERKNVREEALALVAREGKIFLEKGGADRGRWRAGLWDLPLLRREGAAGANLQSTDWKSWLAKRSLAGRESEVLEIRYTVTRHDVVRRTMVVRWKSAWQDLLPARGAWQDLRELAEGMVPAGAPVRKLARLLLAEGGSG